MHSQLAVLGGGPGGYAAAFLAADRGVQVTLIESEPRLGGTCLLRGCIPSKTLLHVARVMAEAEELAAGWGVHFVRPQVDVGILRQRKNKLIETLSSGLGQLAKRRNVRVVHARGTLDNATTLRLTHCQDPDITDPVITFDQLVLATGSIPSALPALRSPSPRVLNSTTALELPEIPASLLVIGGGYIGLELGTVYAQLGSQVSVVELTDGLLPGVDRDLVKPLHRRLTTLLGNRIHLRTKVLSLKDVEDAVEVTMTADGKSVTERYSHVLVAVGRQPASQRLGLERTSVQLDERGFVLTDSSLRTAEPTIWAVGDVTGEPMLAHKATHQAKVAIATILGQSSSFVNRTIPAVVFTDPEIAWAGLTEEQAKRLGREVRVTAYPWAASGRAHSLNRTDGLTKWLIDPATERLVGCGLVGCGAGELIGEAVVAIDRGCTVPEMGQAIHPHPTLSETLMNAAEADLGSAIEIYKPRRR
ncbi:MAG: dihydrolipoyl dehydrogenase [Pirellulaceae bacterium]